MVCIAGGHTGYSIFYFLVSRGGDPCTDVALCCLHGLNEESRLQCLRNMYYDINNHRVCASAPGHLLSLYRQRQSSRNTCAISQNSFPDSYDHIARWPTPQSPRDTDALDSSPPRPRHPELVGLQKTKTASITTPKYSSMRPLIQNTWRIRASLRMTLRNTQSHQHASRCSCATLSKTHSTTLITGIFRNRLQYSRPLGSPSIFVPSATRSSFRTRSRDGIQHMVPIPKGRADRFGTRLRNFSRCVTALNIYCY